MTNPTVLSPSYDANIVGNSVSSFARVFNKETKIKNFEHYLQQADTAVTFKALNNNTPKTFYNFTLNSDEFYSMQIGDIVRINNVDGRLVNLGSEVDIVVFSLSKSATLIKVDGYEFSKIP